MRTYTEQLCIEHQRVGSFGEVITLEVQITQLVQVPDVQLVTLNVMVKVLNSSPSITDVHTHIKMPNHSTAIILVNRQLLTGAFYLSKVLLPTYPC